MTALLSAMSLIPLMIFRNRLTFITLVSLLFLLILASTVHFVLKFVQRCVIKSKLYNHELAWSPSKVEEFLEHQKSYAFRVAEYKKKIAELKEQHRRALENHAAAMTACQEADAEWQKAYADPLIAKHDWTAIDRGALLYLLSLPISEQPSAGELCPVKDVAAQVRRGVFQTSHSGPDVRYFITRTGEASFYVHRQEYWSDVH